MILKKSMIATNLWKCFPLFIWKKCRICGLSFVREWGWKALVGQHIWGDNPNKEIFMCKECLPTITDAENYILNHKYIPKAPKIATQQILRHTYTTNYCKCDK